MCLGIPGHHVLPYAGAHAQRVRPAYRRLVAFRPGIADVLYQVGRADRADPFPFESGLRILVP